PRAVAVEPHHPDDVKDRTREERGGHDGEAEHPRRAELGGGDAGTPRLEREGRERGALRPLARRRHDADERQQEELGEGGRGRQLLPRALLRPAGEEDERDERGVEEDDDAKQPAAGAGVELLAELDEREPVERDGGGVRAAGRAPGGCRRGGCGVRGGHAAISSRPCWAVVSKKRSSRPVEAEGRRSVRTTAAARAARPTSSAPADVVRPAGPGATSCPAAVSACARVASSRLRTCVPGA